MATYSSMLHIINAMSEANEIISKRQTRFLMEQSCLMTLKKTSAS